MTKPAGREDAGPPPPVVRTRELRDRALFDLDDGPVTPSNRADLPALAELLNVLLASLVVASLQHDQHALLVGAPADRPVAEFLHACADRDRAGARLLAARIRQLGYHADLDPQHLTGRSRVAFQTFPDGDLAGILTQNLIGARILVQTLQEAVRWVGDDDPTTRRLLEGLLAEKEAQAANLSAPCSAVPRPRPATRDRSSARP
ncbi:ferritin-like domain-containing protein [Micromonospora radicis]|uniref:Ferritin-like domain-containing protein n=1 Tax=Micromonospora radicis TaxID=1894971 RepID=A0A418N0N0_9ACTN|nr:ferritin-like domain-containing protein [Micromonospora radicis]RIV40891.1 ferritin-like domain-containing protein [Micromonospora radicis]